MTCTSTKECVIPKECYIDPYWSKNETLCTCSAWFMTSGENCNEITTSLRLYQVIAVLISLWSTTVVFLYLFLLRWYFEWRSTVKRERLERYSLKPTLLPTKISTLSFFSALFILLGYLVYAPVILGRGTFEHEESDVFGEKEVQVYFRFGYLSTGFFTAGAFFYVLASLQIALHWLKLCDTVNYVLSFKLPYDNKIKVLSTIMYLSAIVFLVASLFIYGFGYSYVVSLLTGVLGTLYIFFLSIARKRTATLFEKIPGTMKNQKAFNNTLKFVRTSTQVVIPITLVAVLLFTVHGVLIPLWKKILIPETFNFILFLRDAAVMGGLSLLTFNYWYATSIFSNLLQLWEKKLSQSKRFYRNQSQSRERVTYSDDRRKSSVTSIKSNTSSYRGSGSFKSQKRSFNNRRTKQTLECVEDLD